jgi:unspecific monooxygenase
MQVLSQPPRDPDFVQDPYSFYDHARATGPLFLWEDYGFPCAAGFDAVNALLRDRRFGREPVGGPPERPAHLRDFYALDDHGMLDREPPPTPACAAWCCAPSPPAAWRRWRRRSPRSPTA